MTRAGQALTHRLLLALALLYSLFPIYFITVQSLKTPQEDVFGLRDGAPAKVLVPEIPGQSFTGRIARNASASQRGIATGSDRGWAGARTSRRITNANDSAIPTLRTTMPAKPGPTI